MRSRTGHVDHKGMFITLLDLEDVPDCSFIAQIVDHLTSLGRDVPKFIHKVAAARKHVGAPR